MTEGLGGILFEAAEKGLENSPTLHAGLNDFVNHTFTLDSKLTGQGGGMIKKMLSAFGDRRDYHLSNMVKIAKTSGSTIEPHIIQSQAVQKARAEVFGAKHENLARALHKVQQEHGAFGDEKVRDLTDHLGIYFHDEQYHSKNNRWTSAIPADLSKFKPFKEIAFKPSSYKKPGNTERLAQKVASGAFAYKAGIAHTPQAFVNSLLNARASSLVNTIGEIFGSGYASAKSQLIASNAIGNVLFHEYAQQYNFRNGVISKFLPGSVGEFIHSNYMIPGINAARSMGMIISGLVGKYDAEYAARAVVTGQEKRAALILDRMGINWKDVQQRGGQLTQNEREKAMRSMIQQNMFRDREGARTKVSAATPMGRLFYLFHSFTNMQSRMVVDSARRNLLQVHDPAMLVQNLAALAVVMPTVGNAIYSIDRTVTGKTEHPIDDFTGREKAMYSARNTAEVIESIAHMGGFGSAYGLIQAGARYRLANYILGAPLSAGLELSQDAIKAKKADDTHPHAADQFKRDILHDIPSMGIGAYIANRELPTRQAIEAARPMTPKRMRAKMAARARQARHKIQQGEQ